MPSARTTTVSATTLPSVWPLCSVAAGLLCPSYHAGSSRCRISLLTMPPSVPWWRLLDGTRFFLHLRCHGESPSDTRCHQLQADHHRMWGKQSLGWGIDVVGFDDKNFQVTPDVISYTSAISACEKGGQSQLWQVALTVFDAMARVKVVPSSITYNVTPCAVGNGGQWRKVLLLFEEMPNARVTPEVVSYSSAISAFEKGGQWQLALLLFEAMSKSKVPRNVISYSSAIRACGHEGQWPRALMLLEAMPTARVRADVISHSSAISACEKAGHWHLALNLFWAMPNGNKRWTSARPCRKPKWGQTSSAILQPSLLVRSAVNGSRPWNSLRRCPKPQSSQISSAIRSPSVLVRRAVNGSASVDVLRGNAKCANMCHGVWDGRTTTQPSQWEVELQAIFWVIQHVNPVESLWKSP